MNKIVLGLTFLVIAASSAADSDSLSDVMERFNEDFFQAVRVIPGNIVYCPGSLLSLLSIPYVGARCNTKDEIQKVCYFPNSTADTVNLIGPPARALKQFQIPGVQMNYAVGAFINSSYCVYRKYLRTVKDGLQCTLAKTDYTDPEIAARSINSWSTTQTKHNITGVAQSSALSSSTTLGLFSTCSLQGTWAVEFPEEQTAMKPFYLNCEDTMLTDFMSVTSNFAVKHLDDLNATLVVMPYEGNFASFIAVKPDGCDDLSAMERKLIHHDLRNMSQGAEMKAINLTIPKFTSTKTCPLNGILTSMGINDLFTDDCNLCGVSCRPEGLKVSAAFHKATFGINERGAQPANCTDVPETEIDFNAPFFYYVLVHEPATILFMGSFRSTY